jgi:protein-S-isoprenylcysteine O-methyltransferase Ste14
MRQENHDKSPERGDEVHPDENRFWPSSPSGILSACSPAPAPIQRAAPANILKRTMTELETSSDNPRVIAFPPFIWAVGAVISVLVHFFVIQVPIMRYGICLVCGIVLVILAPTLALSALVTMKAAGTNVDPAKPALTIVRGGPFRFTRNPMYLALCLLQVALGFFLNDWITLLFVVPLALILHYGVILREERYLTAKFGEPYLQLKRDVRRWF